MNGNDLVARMRRRLEDAPRYPAIPEPADQRPVESPGAGVVPEGAFWARVAEEAKRSDRHDRPFTLLVLRQQSTEGSLRSLGSSLLDVVDPRFVRETDVVAFLEGELAMGLLLPETRSSEAVALVERVQAMDRDRAAHVVAAMEYPRDADRIDALRARAT